MHCSVLGAPLAQVKMLAEPVLQQAVHNQGHKSTMFGPEFSSDDAGDGPPKKQPNSKKRHKPSEKESPYVKASKATIEATEYHEKSQHLPHFQPQEQAPSLSMLIMGLGHAAPPEHPLLVLAKTDYAVGSSTETDKSSSTEADESLELMAAGVEKLREYIPSHPLRKLQELQFELSTRHAEVPPHKTVRGKSQAYPMPRLGPCGQRGSQQGSQHQQGPHQLRRDQGAQQMSRSYQVQLPEPERLRAATCPDLADP